MTPRILPLPFAQWDLQTQEKLQGAILSPEGQPLNLFSTLAHHPKLLQRWMVFASFLLAKGELPARERELLILRTAWNCSSEYEWGQHVLIGRAQGISDSELARLRQPLSPKDWSGHQFALLTAADELHLSSRVSQETWAVLTMHYSPKQLIEVPFVVGQYHLVAFTLNALEVQREAGVPGFAEPAQSPHMAPALDPV